MVGIPSVYVEQRTIFRQVAIFRNLFLIFSFSYIFQKNKSLFFPNAIKLLSFSQKA